MNANDHHDFDAIAQRLIAACPVERPEPPKPSLSRAAWLADRAEILRAGRWGLDAIDPIRADRLREVPALAHARRFRDVPAGDPRSILLLLGGTGAGKTTATAWLAAEVGGSRPGLVRAGELERAGRYDRELAGWILDRTLLVVDDLGVEYQDSKGAFRSLLDELIDVAYSHRRKMVITSNLDEQGIADRVGARIWSRFAVSAEIAHCGGVDLRRGRP